MKPNIATPETIDWIFKSVYRKGTVSNSCLLPAAFKELAEKGNLRCALDEENAYLFVQEPKALRLYYFINDLNRIPDFESDSPLMAEVLFRGVEGAYPAEEASFLEKSGFQPNLIRDQYNCRLSDVPAWAANVRFASNQEEVLYALALFHEAFDSYSGDYIPDSEAGALLEEKRILVAEHDGKLAGAIHVEDRSKVFWIAHVCVSTEFRGCHVGKSLVESYLALGHERGLNRFALWVQRQNLPAVRMYEGFGFKFTNKSSLSLIKGDKNKK